MARIKGALATRKRRKKILKLAKGYWGSKSKHFKMAKQAVMKSGNYAYIGRKAREERFSPPVDYPHFRCLPCQWRQLFRVYERTEKSRRNPQP